MPNLPAPHDANGRTAHAEVVAWCATNQDTIADDEGIYLQMLPTVSNVPDSAGADHVQDLVQKPTDRGTSPSDWGLNLTDRKFRHSIDCHDGPDGLGYSVHTEISIGGSVWRLSTGVGAHSVDSSDDWLDVTPE